MTSPGANASGAFLLTASKFEAEAKMSSGAKRKAKRVEENIVFD